MMMSQYKLTSIALVYTAILVGGCTSPENTFYDNYAYLSPSESDTLSKPYRYKNPQPVSAISHRFVVVDRYTGREFGVVLRGLKTSLGDSDADKFTDMNLKRSLSGKDIYLLKDSVEELPNGDVKAIVYVIGQSAIGHDLTTGESSRTVLRYNLPQFICLYEGIAIFDEADTKHPLYEQMQYAQEHAKENNLGFWSGEQEWRNTLENWITFKEKQQKKREQFYPRVFHETEALVKDRRPNNDAKICSNLSNLIVYAQKGNLQREASVVLKEVIQKSSDPEERAMAILSLLCVAQQDTQQFIASLEDDQDQMVLECVEYAQMLLDDELNLDKVRHLPPSANSYVKSKAVLALTYTAGRESIPVLLEFLKEDGYPLKNQTLLCLGRLDDPTIASHVVEMMKVSYPKVYIAAIGLMEDFSGEIWSQDQNGVQQIFAWWEEHKDDPVFNTNPDK